MMTVGSLFAGIGGFDLGLERAGFSIQWQVELDPYCQRVLAKHWPNVTRYGDITGIDWTAVEPVDVLCGGFPCQDLSCAGKQAGIDGSRSGLWSEYVRAIRALRPRYIIVENVPGLLANPAMGRVLGDLAELGYDAEWTVLSAAAFGALHLRKRVWLLSYPSGKHGDNGGYGTGSVCGKQPSTPVLPGSQENVADADAERWDGRAGIFGAGWRRELTHSDWWAVEPDVGRVAYGIPARVDRLRGLGNAIVPQITEWIGRRIKEIEG